jgi:hypothetical protein
MSDDNGYIGDAASSDRADSYLGNPDTIFHGENDEFTQRLDARMIARLTPAERLKMGAELPEKLAARVETAVEKATQDLYAARKAPKDPAPHRGALTVVIIVLVLLALLVVAKLAHGGEVSWINPYGKYSEIPGKSIIPLSSPAPTTP